MINHSDYPQTRPRCRVFCFFSVFNGLVFLKYAFLVFVVLGFQVSFALADTDELDSTQARQECFKGKTIYCLALGIKEEKAGYQERALELYRIACKKHPTPGHLRACTPLLSLARKMNRLDTEAAPLEARCKEGKPVTCFYLGKEYLKLTAMQRAARHLEPLCRSGFRPPDSDDYGPCYHLAKAFEQAGQWNWARELFQFDCEHSAVKGQPSCLALKELAEMEKVHRELAQRGIRKFDLVEVVLFFVVLMSCLHVWVWFKGGRGGLKYLALVAPVVVWGAALAWVYWPDKPEFPASQWAVIYFALLQVSGMAVFACLKLRAGPASR